MSDFLTVVRGDAPLIVSIPHAGTEIPAEIETRLVSPWLARKDADWHVDRLYAFAESLGATIVRTAISRTVIDVNRDPGGASLYPGMATTELCPEATFDGEPLYLAGKEPTDEEIVERRGRWFDPYHAALSEEIARLRAGHSAIVLYEAHSIRSHVPRLFDGQLPNFNIGSADGASCNSMLTKAVKRACSVDGFDRVVDGRFKGGWTTRHHGNPSEGVHAIQMELACRTYMEEPETIDAASWPTEYDAMRAVDVQRVLEDVLDSAIDFAKGSA